MVTALGICAVVGLLCVYMAVRAVDLFRTGSSTRRCSASASCCSSCSAALLVVGEVRFGLATQRLGERLADEGGLPTLPEDAARLPSGRLPKEAAVALSRARAEVAPVRGRGFNGDATAGRRAMRRAVGLERAGGHRESAGRTGALARRTSARRCVPRRRCARTRLRRRGPRRTATTPPRCRGR